MNLIRNLSILSFMLLFISSCSSGNDADSRSNPTVVERLADKVKPNSSAAQLTEEKKRRQEYEQILELFRPDYAIESDGRFINKFTEDKFLQFSQIPAFRGCAYGLAGYNSPFGIDSLPYRVDLSASGEPEPGNVREGARDLADTAIIEVQLSAYMERLNIPKSVYWEPLQAWVKKDLDWENERNFEEISVRLPLPCNDFCENAQIFEYLAMRLDGEFILEINRRLKTAKLGEKLQLEPTDGCGAGEVAFKIQTSPRNARASLIQLMDFRLCEVRRIDPYNREKCRGWVDFRDGQNALLSGKYRWEVAASGKVSRGVVEPPLDVGMNDQGTSKTLLKLGGG
jgi:hypothetical protein